MKKTIFFGVIFVLFSGFLSAQTAQQMRVAKILEILDENFEKYPYVTVLKPSPNRGRASGIEPNNGSPVAIINNKDPLNSKDLTPKSNESLRVYEKNMAQDANGNNLDGERVTFKIRQDGMQYDGIILFYPAKPFSQNYVEGGKQQDSKIEESSSAKRRLEGAIFTKLRPPKVKEQASSSAAAQDASTAPAN